MSMEEHDPNMESQLYDHEVDHELEAILEEYRKSRLKDMLIGPVVSLVFHLILIVSLLIFMVPQPIEEVPEVVVQMEELEVKEIDQEEIEELEELEEEIEEIEEYDDPVEDVAVEDTLVESEEMPDDMPEVEEDLALNEMTEIKAVESPLVMNSLYGARTVAGKSKSMGKYGGRYGKQTQRAVKATLAWFRANQHPDGYWPKEATPEQTRGHTYAMTGLATLAYLANGITPTDEDFGETVEKAINWLSSHVDVETGLILPGVHLSNHYVYENAIVCYAISEAYGMTKIGSLKPIMDAMVKKIIETQRADGTWAYKYAVDTGHSDVSVAGWHLQALKAAYASDCKVEGLEKAQQRGVEMLIGAILDDGAAFYDPQNKRNKRLPIGAVAGLCMQLLGEGKHERVSKVFNRIKSDFRQQDPKTSVFDYNNEVAAGRSKVTHHVQVYDWYYQTQVVFQRGDMSFWRIWNDKFLYGQITKNQVKEKVDDVELGYWNWPARKVTGWMRVYSTALNCLSLEVYYRNLPTFKKHKTKKVEKTAVEDTLFGETEDDDIF